MFPFLLALALGLSFAAGSLAFRVLRGRPAVLRLGVTFGAAVVTWFGTWAATMAAFFVLVAEPWPLSRRQGPDTEYAHERFAHHLGEPPGEAVAGVYCREEWGFGGDTVHSLRFTFRDGAVIARIVEHLSLEPVPAGERADVRYLSAPGWWPPEAELDRLGEVYRRGRVDFLWVDRDTGSAYVQRANF